MDLCAKHASQVEYYPLIIRHVSLPYPSSLLFIDKRIWELTS